MGILVCIPGDEHNGIQSKRPGIVLSSHPNYIVIQLLSTQPSDHDLGTLTINNKISYISPIYLINIIKNQVLGFWFDYNTRKPIYLNKSSKLMKIIESNPYKANSITLKLKEYLELKNSIINQSQVLKIRKQMNELTNWNKDLQQEIQQLKNEIDLLKNSKSKTCNRG
ncbi:hypothetical protein [Spiroplasma endosymbiont of Apeira syringaria]|uniref:hypothetical protein n=2 Tax=unclassified Spiroplasma TaxID=2637901 RepID=UPI0030D2C3B7